MKTFRRFSGALLLCALAGLMTPVGQLSAQHNESTTSSPSSPSPSLTQTSPHEMVSRALLRARLEVWDAQSSYRRGQRAGLASLQDAGAASRLATFSMNEAVHAAEQQVVRVYLDSLPAPEPEPEQVAPSAEEEALAQSIEQERKAEQARLALEEARRQEAAEQDLAQRALLKRKRELAEERVTWTERSGKALLDARTSLNDLETGWTAFIEPLTVAIEELPESLTQAQRVERVDPLMTQLITYRRELWKDTATTRETLDRALEQVLEREQALAAAQRDLAQLGQQPVRSNALRTLREEVLKGVVSLSEDKLAASRELVGVLRARLEMQNQHVEEVSMAIRRVLPAASDSARAEFYDLFKAQNWRDAVELFRDRVAGWRTHLTQRWLTANTMGERLSSVLLWGLALLPRLFLFVLATLVLRFIPALLRRMLDMLLHRAVFRRNPGWAIKIYEVARVSFKPAIFFWVTGVIFDYILLSFPEAIALWGAIEAGFVFWFVDRIARTLFFSRRRREASGYASSGEIDDLTPTEARMADVFLLEQELADRAVRSTRAIALLIIAWTWALDLLYAIVGYSVISFLIRWVLIFAIFGVVFGFLSRWRTEIAQLFSRLLGDRAPAARSFVENHKDRPWGVAVIAGAAIVVLVGELFYFVRRHVLSTQAFRQANNFFFARKVELQSRLEERRFEPAVLTGEQAAIFDPATSADVAPRVDRGLLSSLQAHHDTWATTHRQGSVVCIAERGVGLSTLLGDFAAAHDVQVISAPHVHAHNDAMEFVATLFEVEPVVEVSALTAMILEAPSRVIVVDDLEHLFVRTVDGYAGLRALCQIISDTDHVHFWVVGCNKQTWDFLQKVAELSQYFGHEMPIKGWSMSELREMLLARSDAASLSITFQSLDANATGARVVKTEEGYFRYLEDFVRGNPAAALHYWCQSLCVEESAAADYSVQLFERKHAQVLTRLGDKHTFLLSALIHYSHARLDQLAEAMNMSASGCRMLLDRLDDLEIIAWQPDGFISIERRWHPLVLRYLYDSNLLLS